MSAERDMTPAVGTPGGPAFGQRSGEKVALHVGEWRDGRWSYLYDETTGYASEPAGPGVAAAAERARGGDELGEVQGPMILAPVWTWEVPLYFWFGGIAAGSSFAALACDLAGDARSARIARRVALAALVPSPALLVADLGRPARFLHMLRVFKPRSPMSMGAWALTAFGAIGSAAVGADLAGRGRAARGLGAANAVVGGYLGSYTGVLLAATAVPVWARSRLWLGPIFVCTAAATGTAATRLVLVACGLPAGHPTRAALGRAEAGAIAAELALSSVNERRLGEHGAPLTRLKRFKAAKWAARAALALRAAPRAGEAASVLTLAAGLLFRSAWVAAGRASAGDHRAVAAAARSDG